MILILSLLVPLTLAVLGWALFKRFFPAIVTRRLAWTGSSVLIICAGVAIQYAQSQRLSSDWRMREWPVTEGKVVGSQVSGQRAFHPEIRYQYVVDGTSYAAVTDLEVPGFGTKSSRLNVAEKTVVEYPAGRIITVHYDPANPQVSRLRIAPSYTTFLLLTVGGFLLGAGALGLCAGLWKFQS